MFTRDAQHIICIPLASLSGALYILHRVDRNIQDTTCPRDAQDDARRVLNAGIWLYQIETQPYMIFAPRIAYIDSLHIIISDLRRTPHAIKALIVRPSEQLGILTRYRLQGVHGPFLPSLHRLRFFQAS